MSIPEFLMVAGMWITFGVCAAVGVLVLVLMVLGIVPWFRAEVEDEEE